MTWFVMTPVSAGTQGEHPRRPLVMDSEHPVRVSQHRGVSVMTSGFGTPGANHCADQIEQ